MADKRLISIKEFNRVAALTRMTDASLDIVKRILVKGEMQAGVARSLKPAKSPQHVSLLVNVFWKHYERSYPLPKGWLRDSACLPKRDWPMIRQMDANALRALADQGSNESDECRSRNEK